MKARRQQYHLVDRCTHVQIVNILIASNAFEFIADFFVKLFLHSLHNSSQSTMAQTDLKTLIEVTSSGGESFVKDAYYKVFDTKREVGFYITLRSTESFFNY